MQLDIKILKNIDSDLLDVGYYWRFAIIQYFFLLLHCIYIHTYYLTLSKSGVFIV